MSDIHDSRTRTSLRVLLYGAAVLVGTLGVTTVVLYLVAVLPPSLPLFLVFLFVGLLAIVAAPSLVVWALDAVRYPADGPFATTPPATCDCSCTG